MRRLAVLLLALSPSLAWAQTVTMPQSVLAKRGRSVQVEIVYDGDDLKWTTPPELDVFREWSDDAKNVSLRVLVPPETPDGSYQISAVTAKLVGDKAKLSKFGSCLIVVGGTPPVPPGPPEPPKPPGPPAPPTPAGSRIVMIFHESGQQTPAQGILFNELQSGASGTYLRSKGHKVHILDDDSVGSDGKPALESWAKHLAGIALPAIVIADDKGNVVHKGPCPATTADVLNTVKASGG